MISIATMDQFAELTAKHTMATRMYFENIQQLIPVGSEFEHVTRTGIVQRVVVTGWNQSDFSMTLQSRSSGRYLSIPAVQVCSDWRNRDLRIIS